MIITLVVGVDMRLAINIDNDFAVADIFILKYLFLFKVKLLLHNQDVYIKLGKEPYRKLSFYIQHKKKYRQSQLEFPIITINKMRVRLTAGVENSAFADTMMWGGFELILSNLQSLASHYCKIKKYDNIISPSYTDDVAKLNIDINIKSSILKIMSFALFKAKDKVADKPPEKAENKEGII